MKPGINHPRVPGGRFVIAAIAAPLVALAIALAPADAPADHENSIKGLKITDSVKGTGDEAVRNSRVEVHYTGSFMDGKVFDSSVERGEPFVFRLGTGSVIRGWEYGIMGMRVGGKRELVIPPELAYGKDGIAGAIPPNSTLRFEVELLGVTGPDYTNIGNTELKELLARGVPIVDIRTPGEWRQTGVIEGSKRITAFDEKGQFVKTFMDEFSGVAGKDDEVIIICRTGNRTSVIAQTLSSRMGYKKIYNVKAGIVEWMGHKNPVVK